VRKLKRIPERRCVVCNTVRSKNELLRIVKNKKYYICTTRFSDYQTKAVTRSIEQNSSRASNNQGLKPWGFKK